MFKGLFSFTNTFTKRYFLKYSILIKNADKAIFCGEDKDLMTSLKSQSSLIPKGCHNGACGVCKIQVHSGKYVKSQMNRKHISTDEESNDVVLACKVFPKSDMEIEFIQKKKKNKYYLGDKIN